MIVMSSCSLSAVADGWSGRLGQSFHTVRERLRDTDREQEAKTRRAPPPPDAETCWVPWLGWVLEEWSGTQWAVALDAMSLGQRVVVLAISVLYWGFAVPVAWKVLKAGEKQAWKLEWLSLLEQF